MHRLTGKRSWAFAWITTRQGEFANERAQAIRERYEGTLTLEQYVDQGTDQFLQLAREARSRGLIEGGDANFRAFYRARSFQNVAENQERHFQAPRSMSTDDYALICRAQTPFLRAGLQEFISVFGVGD